MLYDNPIVKKEQELLTKRFPDLKISYVSSIDNKVLSVGIQVKLKGNKELISNIIRSGWEQRLKRMYNSEYYVMLEKYIQYKKYAIYKTDFGLRAKEYYDKYSDLKRYGLTYIKEEYLPVTVNRMGGFTSFDLKYEKNFVEIIEVLEGEDPLTREQMYPKNSELFKYGWIDRSGNTYTCGFEGHYYAAEAICKELNMNPYNPERTLENLGWIKLSRPAPYSPDNLNQIDIYYDINCEAGIFISKRQYEVVKDMDIKNRYIFEVITRKE